MTLNELKLHWQRHNQENGLSWNEVSLLVDDVVRVLVNNPPYMRNDQTYISHLTDISDEEEDKHSMRRKARKAAGKSISEGSGARAKG